jgi:hypothetical protein
VLSPRFGETIAAWVLAARQRLDPDLGAVSHAADADSGRPWGGVRGSNLALVSRVLIDADAVFARGQYTILRSSFVDYKWGVPGVREYPHGFAGAGDIDSGPIFLGFSGPAVVVGAAAAGVHGDARLARTLLGAVEVGGMPFQVSATRRYLAGAMPVGDAFIAWARSPTPGDVREGEARGEVLWDPLISRWWAAPAHLVSAVLVSLLLLPVVRLVRTRSATGGPGRR